MRKIIGMATALTLLLVGCDTNASGDAEEDGTEASSTTVDADERDQLLAAEICEQALEEDYTLAARGVVRERVTSADTALSEGELRSMVDEECFTEIQALGSASAAEARGDEAPAEQPTESEAEPEAELEIIDGPVRADASGIDWDAIVADGGESLPGISEVFIGTGDDIIDLESPVTSSVVALRHGGSSNFVVRPATSGGEGSSIVNDIGPYTGRVLAEGRGDDIIGFDVRADGEWVIVAMNPILAREAELARTYEGVGDSVIVFPLDLDDPMPIDVFGRVTLEHDGESNFIVRELFGRSLVNEIGAYSGTVRLPTDGLLGVTIRADGAWVLSFE